MTHTIEVSGTARRQLRKLDRSAQRKIADRINGLAENPRPAGAVKLTDVSPAVYRVREGRYRILYTIEDDLLVVVVVRVAHRSEAYR